MKKIISLLLCLLVVCAVSAQIRGEEISVVVSPDHTDWQYKPGEKCVFNIQVFKAQNLLPGAVIDYELGPELFPSEVKKDITLKDGSLKVSAILKNPGFLRCKVKATVNGKSYEGLATTAYAPESLKPATQEPADFMDYWQAQADYARQTPLDLRMVLWGERCTATDNVYKVNFRVRPWGGRIYGVLSVPKAEGKYPALLRVPGAGVRPYNGDTYTAPGKLITLEIGIHGVPIDMEQQVYDDLGAGALNCYWFFNRDNRDRMYYNRVIVGALRAVDVICSLPQYNGQALGVCGSSQGGALSIITAALDNRVTCLAPVHPALCDHEGFLVNNRAGGWPHYYKELGQPNDKELQTARYYDTVNFARHLTQPGWYAWGYNDEVCAPTSMYAAYNVISAPKELHLYLETGHYWYQEQWDAWQNWLKIQLGIRQ